MGEESMAQTETPRPAGSDQSLGELVAQATKDVSQLFRGELNLAKAELRIDVRRIGLAVALLGMAAFIGCLMLVLLCFAFAYGLQALGIWDWASFLIVAGVCLAVIALAALIAVLRVRGVTGLRTTRSSVQDTITMLRGGDRRPEIAGPAQQ
jgi:Putative Actinobacterial Holin-X, holin superfamily III